MKKLQQGLTLIKMMFLIAVVGVSVAFVIPAWEDHEEGKKVMEAPQVEKSIAAQPLE